ncbi:MAG: hypothetical protein GEV05_14630 [Betaproteobacteria bacterium]|nr:hypothetical protein [Betaproteobacteria bacterium]
MIERTVHVTGITRRPDEAWMLLQIGRNLVDEQDGGLAGKKYLIIDRDTKYSQRFRVFSEEGGTKLIRLPPLSPHLNAYAERAEESIDPQKARDCCGRCGHPSSDTARRNAHYYNRIAA